MVEFNCFNCFENTDDFLGEKGRFRSGRKSDPRNMFDRGITRWETHDGVKMPVPACGAKSSVQLMKNLSGKGGGKWKVSECPLKGDLAQWGVRRSLFCSNWHSMLAVSGTIASWAAGKTAIDEYWRIVSNIVVQLFSLSNKLSVVYNNFGPTF